MSELQIALAVIGGVVVIGVLVYNRIQERRYRKQAEATFRSLEQDPLMNVESEGYAQPARAPQHRVEPGLQDPHFEDDFSEFDDAADVHEPRFGEMPRASTSGISPDTQPGLSPKSVQQAAPLPPRTPSPVKPTRESGTVEPVPPFSPHEQAIEYRVHIRGEGVLASVFADAINQSKTLGKQIRWVGFPAKGNAWEELRPWSDIHYREIIVAIQLADRNGSISEQELTSLCSLVRDAAQPHSLRVTCDDFDESLERARLLDLFCVDVDVLIGLNVVARGEESLPMHHVRREAEIASMVLAPDGTYQLQDRRGEILY
jgi:hypothetical protein